MYRHILLTSILLAVIGCTPHDATGPEEIRWDREVCARCGMAVGDRNFAAQVRGAPAGERTHVYKFDDIGCAVIWLQQQAWKHDPRTEVWVMDYFNGGWLDARTASYVSGKLSPMNYGLAAQAEASADTLDFEQAVAHIMTVEDQHHLHGGHEAVIEQ